PNRSNKPGIIAEGTIGHAHHKVPVSIDSPTAQGRGISAEGAINNSESSATAISGATECTTIAVLSGIPTKGAFDNRKGSRTIVTQTGNAPTEAIGTRGGVITYRRVKNGQTGSASAIGPMVVDGSSTVSTG